MSNDAVSSAQTASGSRRVGVIALVFAALYSAALIAAGFFVPSYSTQSSSSSGEAVQGSTTLVGENGVHVVFVLAIPLLLTLAVGASVLSGRGWGLLVARILTGLLVVFNVLALMSIGIFVVPVTLALVVVCLTWPSAQGGPAQTRSESLR